MRILIGGQVIQIDFGVTFVVVEGFSPRDGHKLEWRLRLDKEFYVKSLKDNQLQQEKIDIYNDILFGAETLIRCCGQNVDTFCIEEGGLLVTFANQTSLRLNWANDEVSCGNLYATMSEDFGVPQLICAVTLPDDI